MHYTYHSMDSTSPLDLYDLYWGEFYLHYSLCSLLFWAVTQHWLILTDVLGQPIGYHPQDGTDGLSRNFYNYQSTLHNIADAHGGNLISRKYFHIRSNYNFPLCRSEVSPVRVPDGVTCHFTSHHFELQTVAHPKHAFMSVKLRFLIVVYIASFDLPRCSLCFICQQLYLVFQHGSKCLKPFSPQIDLLKV